MKTKRKKIWNFVALTVIAITLLLSFLPVGRFVHDISTCYYSTDYYWGPMGGPVVNEPSTKCLFFLLMIVYLLLISILFVVVYKQIKK